MVEDGGRPGPPAHGVDVRDGVGGGDAAEPVGVVADRRDEVGGGDQGPAGVTLTAVEKVDPGIVGRFRANQDALVAARRRERADQFRQVPRTYLGGSAAGGRAGGEAELAPEPCHGGRL